MHYFALFNFINLATLTTIAVRIFWKREEKIVTLVILTSLFSILASFQYLLFNAPDVAITEASIGACLATIFILKASSSIETQKVQLENLQPIIEDRLSPKINSRIFVIFFVLFIIFFIKTSVDFPKILSEEIPSIYNHTIKHYIYQTQNFLKFSNIVTAVIISFRGYDTMIETIVILTAAISVIAILPKSKPIGIIKKSILNENSVVTNMVMLIIPFIVLFAFYIQAHGEESPGGGFQSGSILACAVIGYALTISEDVITKYLRNSLLLKIGAFGVLTYFTVGLIPVLKNQNFLNHNYFLCPGESREILCFSKSQKAGIFLAELGVGITVFSVMSIIFLNLRVEKTYD